MAVRRPTAFRRLPRGGAVNYAESIEIGRHVWVGKDVKIGKNVRIADNSIVGWGSIVTKRFDEPNVIRVAHYMRRICDKTQFIVITHRRGTMEAADVLYGVTMQERGVSKVLTINMNDMAKELNIKG